LGGLEAIFLLWLLRLVRSDYKVIANVVDKYLVELEGFFIFTNPMAKGGSANFQAARLSREWLAEGHLLFVFPAGRVGLYRPVKGYVTDESWDESALRLGLMTGATFVPVYVEGESSPLFSALSEYVYPMKLLFLLREFLGSLHKRVVFHVGRPIDASRLAAMGRKKAKAWLRMRTFLLCPPGKGPTRRRRGAPGALHPEVEDYLARWSLDEEEIAELVAEAGVEREAIERALGREEK
jgi:putative hemolysin